MTLPYLPVFVATILQKGTKICLMKRSKNVAFYPDFYAFSGGLINHNEHVIDAAVREAYEELGLHIKPEDLTVVHSMYIKAATGDNHIVFFMKTEHFSGEARVMEPKKCDEVAWFSLDTLPHNLVPMHKQVLEMIKKNIAFSEYGW